MPPISRAVEELDQLFGLTPVGMCLVDRDMRFRRINEKLASINGRPVDEHLGKTIGDVIPGIAEQVEARYRTVLERGQPVLYVEVTACLPSDPNVEHTWLVSDHPFFSPEGRVEGVMTVVEETASIPDPRVTPRLEALILERNATRDLLDRLPVGVILVDEHRSIVRMNTEAGRLLDLEDGLRSQPSTLCAHSPGATADLHRLVAKAIGGGKKAVGGALRLPRPSGAPALEVAVSPLNGERYSGETRHLALVAVSDGRGRIEGKVETARQLYDLTPTEAGIALQLARGLSLEESARARRIRISTARTHLKRILEKTGARRQPELVRLILTGPMLIARD